MTRRFFAWWFMVLAAMNASATFVNIGNAGTSMVWSVAATLAVFFFGGALLLGMSSPLPRSVPK